MQSLLAMNGLFQNNFNIKFAIVLVINVYISDHSYTT